MEDINKNIAESLDGYEIELIPFFPYLLQDLWALGSDPATALSLINNNIKDRNLKILDLACGKGAVSINIAREMDCTVKGIDIMPDFIESARKYAREYNVQDKCEFEVGDILEKIRELNGFDVVIFGSVGPVIGDLQTSLRAISKLLNIPGYVLLQDGYIDDTSNSEYNRCLRKAEFYRQIDNAGYEIIEEVIFDKEFIKSANKSAYDSIIKRVNELIKKYPDKKEMFEGYLKAQEYENSMLAGEIVVGAWMLRIMNYEL